MIKRLSFTAAILLALSACGKGYDGPPIMAQDMLGCQHRKTYHHIIEMAADKDQAAGSKLIDGAVASGECIELKSGTTVIPQGNVTLDGVVLEKVRLKGQLTEYWTLAKAVKF